VSELGVGTTFWFDLNIYQEDLAKKEGGDLAFNADAGVDVVGLGSLEWHTP
jgi:hypothetical protein